MAETTTAPAAPAAPATNAAPSSAPEPVKTGIDSATKTAEPTKAGDSGGDQLKEGEFKKEENPTDPDKPYKIKIYGKDQNVSLAELQKLAEKGAGADKRFQEAHRMKQQAEQFIRMLRENPKAILTNPKIGIDIKKIAQEILMEEIKREQMSPEQRQIAEMQEKLRLNEEEKKTEAQKQADAHMQELVKHHTQTIEKDIMETLQGSELPKSRLIVKRIAYYMAEGLKRGVELKAADVVGLVKSDYLKELSEFFGSTDGDTMARLLGDTNLKKLREFELKRVQAGGGPTPVTPRTPDTVVMANGDTQKLTKDEWRKHMESNY